MSAFLFEAGCSILLRFWEGWVHQAKLHSGGLERLLVREVGRRHLRL
jgi:hypothetical protein